MSEEEEDGEKTREKGTIERPIIIECDDVGLSLPGNQFRSPVKVVPGNQFRYVYEVSIEVYVTHKSCYPPCLRGKKLNKCYNRANLRTFITISN